MANDSTSLRKPSISTIAVALSIAVLLWLTVLTKMIVDRPTPVFVTVSLKTLLERHIDRLGRENLSSADLQRQSDAYVAALEQIIGQISGKDEVIVLVSEAVVSKGVVDLTPEVARLADEIALAPAPYEIRQ